MIDARQQTPASHLAREFPEKRSTQAKKNSPFRWVLTGMAVVVLFGLALVCVGGYVAYHAAKDAGLNPDLLRRKPIFAMTKLAVAKNPNLEIVSTDENADTITARDRNTSKVITYRYDLDKKSLVVVDDNVNQARISAKGDGVSSSFEVKGPDGTMKFGAAASGSAPQWIPFYTGATVQGTASTTSAEGEQNSFTFKTKDSPSKVLAFYQDSLKGNGFTVNMAMTGDQGGMVQGQVDRGKRTIVITLHSSNEGSEGSIVTVEKK